MRDFYVLKQVNTLYIVRAEDDERAEEIVKTRPTHTKSGEVMQAHGVIDDEGYSSLHFIGGLPDSFMSWEKP